MKLAFVAVIYALIGVGVTHAQMVDEPTCYSWEGGHKSSGSFSKCGPAWVAAAKPAPKTPVAVAPVAPSPIMMPMSCPPVHRITHPIHKRKPRVECKPTS
jgi:hypothetical protein